MLGSTNPRLTRAVVISYAESGQVVHSGEEV